METPSAFLACPVKALLFENILDEIRLAGYPQPCSYKFDLTEGKVHCPVHGLFKFFLYVFLIAVGLTLSIVFCPSIVAGLQRLMVLTYNLLADLEVSSLSG